MNVLVLAPVYPHQNSPTEGLFNEAHSRALAAAGPRVTVIVPKPWLPETLARSWPRYRRLAALPRQETRGSIRILYCRYGHLPRYRRPDWTAASCARAVLKTVRRSGLAGTFDLLQVHSTWPVGMAAPAVSAGLGVPYVVTLHIEDDPRLYDGRAAAELYRETLRRAAALVAVGRPLERFLERFGRLENVHRIPNGVDLEQIHQAVGSAAAQQPWGRVVSVSNLWPVKGVDDNLRALATFDRRVPWHYTVVGEGPERPRLERLARRLSISDRVEFTGRLQHREALRRVAQADVFCLPSWQEAFGVVYLEAMACGKPVVGCRTQGAEDIVRDGVDGLLVEPRNVESLAAALARLIEDPSWARDLGESALRRAGDFTWKRNAERYRSLYQEILRGTRP